MKPAGSCYAKYNLMGRTAAERGVNINGEACTTESETMSGIMATLECSPMVERVSARQFARW